MDRPKKPASGFLRFLTEQFKNFETGKSNYREFQSKIAADWSQLPEEKKKIYNDACRQELVQYKQELAKWEMKMIRLGHTDLVRNDTLIDAVERPKNARTKSAKKPKADSSDSDWELGWCQPSQPDAEHFKISLSEQTKSPISLTSPKLPSDDVKQPTIEMTPASDRDKDITGDKENNNSKPIDPPIVPSLGGDENQPTSKGTLDKLKNFFKF